MKFVGVLLALGLGLSAGAASATNLIQNGDFSGGFVGFTTEYNVVAAAPNALYPEGDITIAANPFSVHDLWVDLGATSNPMLIVNGEASFHAPFEHCTVKYLEQAGVKPTWIDLGKAGIHGNGHMMMLEKNNLEVAAMIEKWLAKASPSETASR